MSHFQCDTALKDYSLIDPMCVYIVFLNKKYKSEKTKKNQCDLYEVGHNVSGQIVKFNSSYQITIKSNTEL